MGPRGQPWEEEDEAVVCFFSMQELGPLAMGAVDPGSDSRDVLVSWHSMRQSFHCCVWAQGLWDRLHPVPGEHDTITGCLT